ncbi:MAG: sugar transferase [Alphaproteobacteria bacterium]|nr:sugar transferase [Alphaproteobacteria bacterium]
MRDEAPEPSREGPGHPQRTGTGSGPAAAPRDGWKRPVDLCTLALGAVLLLPAWIPLVAAAALAVRLDGPGPVLLRQPRLGRHGRVFGMLKFRTMADGAERDTGPAWSPPDDPRVTRVGRVLRRWHLDELPQAVNVLCGEMSLVGPRPERPELAARVEREVPGFAARLAVRPGIAGLAQARGAGWRDPARKLALDLAYIEAMTPWLDARLIALCALRTLRWRGSAPDAPPGRPSEARERRESAGVTAGRTPSGEGGSPGRVPAKLLPGRETRPHSTAPWAKSPREPSTSSSSSTTGKT